MDTDLLIVGGEGDLALRKLYPALFSLDLGRRLGKDTRIVAVARRDLDRDGFLQLARQWFDACKDERPVDAGEWAAFASRLHYFRADATSADALSALQREHFPDPSRELVAYLATPPRIFAPVCRALQAAGLVRNSAGAGGGAGGRGGAKGGGVKRGGVKGAALGTRIVVEKPLGENRESFLQINRELSEIFSEEQVYRIDHYLGKETVQNLLALRFANSFLEPLWNNRYIDNVQITLAESIGVSGRWDFYDQAGAMRDMVQNHLLQLVCLAAMEPPAHLDAGAVRNEKLKVLSCLRPMDEGSARGSTVTGQYRGGAVAGQPVAGYLEEEGAAAQSDTETFVALRAEIDNWRWAGVPFYLRTGKRMQRRCSTIAVEFKQVPHSIFGDRLPAAPNRLIVRLQPDEAIRLELLSKAAGLDAEAPLRPAALDLSFAAANAGQPVPGAYERLLLDVMRGNPTLFMRADEVEEAWKWVDQVKAAWRRIGKRPEPYTAGGIGPAQAIALIARDGREWYDAA